MPYWTLSYFSAKITRQILEFMLSCGFSSRILILMKFIGLEKNLREPFYNDNFPYFAEEKIYEQFDC